jgi:L-asparaginase
MAVRIFITGGTFDKEYNELNGELFFKDSHLPEMLRLGRCKVDVDIRTLMMIDSLEMTDEDRELIARHCETCEEKPDRYYARNRYPDRHRKNSCKQGAATKR